MESLFGVLAFLLQSAAALSVGYGCILAMRWAAGTWPILGYTLALGILIRLWMGLALYVISFWNLPIFASQQLGDGFWHLALDARGYFITAASAAGGIPVPPESPSPSFVEALGLWLRVMGVVPVSAVVFNVALYVASCTMVIGTVRPGGDPIRRRATLVMIGALSFSPLLILLGTQPLKDVFSSFLIVMASAAIASMLLTTSIKLLSWRTAVLVAAVTFAIFLMAGVRAYYALFIWAGAALALAGSIVITPRPIRFAGFALVVLAILWLAFMRGAGPYYVMYGNLITRTLGVRLPVISPIADNVPVVTDAEPGAGAAADSAAMFRERFVRSGGGTNLASETAAGRSHLDMIVPVFTGLAAMFLPISLLKQLSIVQFSGGRGFLVVTDLDTLFVDVALLAVLWVLVTSGPTRRQLPYLLFSFGLAVITALPMAYIVTNYGTLFRLRLLAILPLLLVPLAFRKLDSMGDDRSSAA